MNQSGCKNTQFIAAYEKLTTVATTGSQNICVLFRMLLQLSPHVTAIEIKKLIDLLTPIDIAQMFEGMSLTAYLIQSLPMTQRDIDVIVDLTNAGCESRCNFGMLHIVCEVFRKPKYDVTTAMKVLRAVSRHTTLVDNLRLISSSSCTMLASIEKRDAVKQLLDDLTAVPMVTAPINDLASKLDEACVRNCKLNNEVYELVTANEKMTATLRNTNNDFSDHVAKTTVRIEMLEDELVACKSIHEELEARISELTATNEKLKCEATTRDCVRNDNVIFELEQKIAVGEKTIAELNQEFSKQNMIRNNAIARINMANDDNIAALIYKHKNEIDQLHRDTIKRATDWSQELDRVRAEYNAMQLIASSAHTRNDEIGMLSDRVGKLIEQNSCMSNERDDAREKVATLSKKLYDAENLIAKHTATIEQKCKDVNTFVGMIDKQSATDIEVTKLTEENKALKTTVNCLTVQLANTINSNDQVTGLWENNMLKINNENSDLIRQRNEIQEKLDNAVREWSKITDEMAALQQSHYAATTNEKKASDKLAAVIDIIKTVQL